MVDLSTQPPPAAPVKCLVETRSILAVGLTVMVAVAFILPWLKDIPPGAAQYVGQMQGALVLQWGAALGWYFGGSKTGAAAVTGLVDANATTNAASAKGF